MLNFLFKKERQLESPIYSYLENIGKIQNHFVKAMNTYLKGGVSDDFRFLMDQPPKYESRADDLRDEINELMYSRALMSTIDQNESNCDHIERRIITRLFDSESLYFAANLKYVPGYIQAGAGRDGRATLLTERWL